MVGALYGLAAVGFALIFQAARELHFAYGVTAAMAGYILYSSVTSGLGIWVGLGGAIVAASLLGALSRYVFYRRLGDHFAVLLFSFGLTIVLENVLQAIFGAEDRVIPPTDLTQSITLVPGTSIQTRWIDLIGLATLIVSTALLVLVLKRTRLGLGLNAVMRDPQMADLVGVRVEWMKVVAYAIGCAFAALAGSIKVLGSGVSPYVGFELLLFAFILTVLGGKSITMVAVWGLIIGMLESSVSTIVPAHFAELTVFALVIVYLIIKNLRTPLWVTT